MNTRVVDPRQSAKLIEKILKANDESNSFNLEFGEKLIGYDGAEKVFEFTMPLPFSGFRKAESLADYVPRIVYPFEPYTIILIQAGKCSLGYFENGHVKEHKTLQTYMVRKGHGKNELTHFGKGKKRNSAGSRLRYRRALRFFEEIIEILNKWNSKNRSSRILYSCPVKMWSYMFSSKARCYFDKKDSRLQRIPFYVNTPGFSELTSINDKISVGYLTTYDSDLETEYLGEFTS
jgi:hypothetical protein